MGCGQSPHGFRTGNTLTLLAFSGPPNPRMGFVVGDTLGFPALLFRSPPLHLCYEEVGAVQGSEAAFSRTTQPRLMALGWDREKHKKALGWYPSDLGLQG